MFSHGYPGDEWTTRVVRGDLQAEVTALKAQPGADLLLTGGVSLAAALTDLGLVDEYHIAVHPWSSAAAAGCSRSPSSASICGPGSPAYSTARSS